MNTNDLTFANPMGEFLSPLLSALRATGFFEAPVFMTTMTLLSVLLFLSLRKRLQMTGFYTTQTRQSFRYMWQACVFSLCFLVTNSTAVALKTLIIEETDYVPIPDYIAWVSPLHFLISSLAFAHLLLFWRQQQKALDLFLVAFVQLGLLGGYYIGFHRLTNVTSGISGLLFFIWFGALNWDLWLRLFSTSREPRISMHTSVS